MHKTSYLFKALAALAILGGLATTAPAATNNAVNIPVVGTNSFTGTFHPTGFHYDSGKVYADGIVSGVANTASGPTSVLQTVSAPLVLPPATAPVLGAPTSCQILNLVIGPINLDLLGLTVTTNQITLNISAIPGAGNLLGNLLCDVANLLNSPTQNLASLLNQILGILQGL
jgi:hypothetical protein